VEFTISNRITADRRGVLSSLWIFVLLNMLFRDIHEFLRPGAIEEFMAQEASEGLLLASGIVLSLMISMIVLNRVLSSGAARWANAAIAVVTIAGMLANPPGDLDDIWFFAVEILALLAIVGLAWTWRTDPAERSHDAAVATET
jgi:hypothetical protein